jgi:hypothetical protein
VHNEGGDAGDPIDLNGKSYTVWREGAYRIDIESRNGMKQMHFQEQIRGVNSANAPKYQFNPSTGEFDGMPRSLQRQLAKMPGYQKAVTRASEVFSRVIGTCG